MSFDGRRSVHQEGPSPPPPCSPCSDAPGLSRRKLLQPTCCSHPHKSAHSAVHCYHPSLSCPSCLPLAGFNRCLFNAIQYSRLRSARVPSRRTARIIFFVFCFLFYLQQQKRFFCFLGGCFHFARARALLCHFEGVVFCSRAGTFFFLLW